MIMFGFVETDEHKSHEYQLYIMFSPRESQRVIVIHSCVLYVWKAGSVNTS